MEATPTVKDLFDLAHNPAMWMFALWAGREIYHAFQKKSAALDKSLAEIRTEHTQSIKENTSRMADLTVAIVRLETKLESIESLTFNIPKMKDDLNAIHGKLRRFDPNNQTPS
jgi:DNA repair exonuclease SbcCD ATPase subunit